MPIYNEQAGSQGSRQRRGSYRLTVITKDNSSLPQVKETVAQVDGAIVQETAHGEKIFVYPIQKMTKGLYTSYVVTGEPSKIHQLDQAARGVEGVLRSLLVMWELPKVSKKSERNVESEIKTPAETTLEPKEKETPKEIPTLEKSKKTVVKKPEKPKRPKKAVLESSEDRLKELDEKLAEILKS